MPAAYWGDYMRGDDGLDRFPFVRRRGNVALIALSTGAADGAVHGDRPARRRGSLPGSPTRSIKPAGSFASC